VYYNADGRGFYRTQYSPEALKALPLRTMNPEERIMLLTDEWALARTSQESIANFLNIGQQFSGDKSALVLTTILSRLHTAYRQLLTETDRSQFQQYLTRTYSPVLQQIGMDAKPGESPETKDLREELYGVLGEDANDQTVIQHSQELTAKYLEDPDSVDPSIASTAVNISAVHGDAKLYDSYLAALPKAKSPEQHYTLLYALTSFTDPALIHRTIQYATTDAVRNQDASGIFGTEIANPATRDVAWAFEKENWAAISKQFTTWSGARVVRNTGSFCSESAKQDIQNFFAEHKVEASERSLRQAMEQIDTCMAFKAAQADNLHAWLQQQSH
jgi:aminopeptidase N